MKSKHIRDSLTNQHVNKQDSKLKTADNSIARVSPNARTSVISLITRPSTIIHF